MRVLSIESFRTTRSEQTSRLHGYLEGALLPCLEQVHDGPKIFLEAIVAAHLPEVIFATVFASFDEMLEVRNRIAAEPRIREEHSALESTGIPVLAQVQSQVMMLTGEQCLRLPAGFSSLESVVFELRSYHAAGGPDFPVTRMGAALARAGIYPMVNAAIAAAEHLPRLSYLIPFENLAARHEAWAKLDADPGWLELQRDAIAKHRSALRVTEKSIYKLAPYSKLA
jgi:hypothetical protein